MEPVIAGKSLFNDGVGVVVFSLLLGILASGTLPTLPEAGLLLLREAGGGIAFGLLLGWGRVRLLHSIDEYKVKVLLTLAAVMGGYALASRLHISGPLAMVVAGLMVGNGGRGGHCRHAAGAHAVGGVPGTAFFCAAQGLAQVLTWGGLHGGISVALALSLPAGDGRNTVLALTYCVVVFSILVQGLSIGAVVRASTQERSARRGRSSPRA